MRYVRAFWQRTRIQIHCSWWQHVSYGNPDGVTRTRSWTRALNHILLVWTSKAKKRLEAKATGGVVDMAASKGVSAVVADESAHLT